MFDTIEPFADYSFNKSHTVGYGYVTYQTACLKANHPVEYLAALLTSVKTNKDKAAVYLNECRQLEHPGARPRRQRVGDRLLVRLAPDGDGDAIRFGLSAVRNVGEGVVAHIVAAREEGGPFADFYDFCERVDPSVLNKRTIESLVKAGAFDSLGHPRQGLLLVYEQIVDTRARPPARTRPRVSEPVRPRSATPTPAAVVRRPRSRSPTSSSTSRSGSRSRRRCSAST